MLFQTFSDYLRLSVSLRLRNSAAKLLKFVRRELERKLAAVKTQQTNYSFVIGDGGHTLHTSSH